MPSIAEMEKKQTEIKSKYEWSGIELVRKKPACQFCSSANALIEVNGITICRTCAEKLLRKMRRFSYQRKESINV